MREEYGASKSYPAILRKKYTFKLKDYIKENLINPLPPEPRPQGFSLAVGEGERTYNPDPEPSRGLRGFAPASTAALPRYAMNYY